MTKGYLIKIVISLMMMLTTVTAQENVDAIEKARQAKEAADKAAAEAAAVARDDHGHMVPNADFMRAYFMREEVAPEDGSCPAELALHKRLIDDPFTAVVPTDLFEIADKDVVHNYQAVLNFRNFLAVTLTLPRIYDLQIVLYILYNLVERYKHQNL